MGIFRAGGLNSKYHRLPVAAHVKLAGLIKNNIANWTDYNGFSVSCELNLSRDKFEAF